MMKWLNEKKGQALNVLQTSVIAIGVIAVVVVVVLIMLGKLRDTTTAGSAEYNAATEAISAVDDVPTFLPLIVISIIAFVVIGIILLLQRR